ncbi:MAG: DNA repair protein RecO [Candidatus Omnitrophica bacterium]|nr:DNA repair protein RecO [Candidatus Omnitrophota bacterium]
MAIQKTAGFILKKRELRETSLVLIIYTRDFGKIRTVVKGVRSPENLFRSSYELFALDEVVFYEKKKKDFFTLSQCELVDFFPRIRADFERLLYALYFIETLDAVTVFDDANKALYELLQNSLSLLSTKASAKRTARIFEVRLLNILGFMPTVNACAGCGSRIANSSGRFSFSLGGVLCKGCFEKDRRASSITAGTINFISKILELPHEKATRIKVSNAVGRELERILKNFLRYHMDTKSKTLNFIEKIGV